MTVPDDPTPQDDRPDDRKEDLLREAERLIEAAREKSAEEAGPFRSFLVFSVGVEWYAVDLASVRKVIRPTAFAHVPGASAEVVGLMNCHGEVLCVLDLRKILGMPPDPAPPDGRFVVVLAGGGKEAGILVDAADDVWELPASEVRPTLESLDPAKAKLFEGTVSRGGRFVGLLSATVCLNP